jgi:AcrR family transcriptional regulator
MKSTSSKHAAAKAPKRTAEESADKVRDRILETASELIYREGARAVGVDRIVAESGVAKMSLYRWFPSKDDLIVAVLQENEKRLWAVWDENLQRFPGEPLKQLRAQFESLAAAIQRPTYRGCAFQNAVTAFADDAHPSRAVVCSFKEELTRRALELTTALGAKDPLMLAEQLSLVADGAHASGQAIGQQGPSKHLMGIVDALIAAQLPHKPN